MSEPIRLATVKATGKRYVVQSLDFPRDRANNIIDAPVKVHCWGEVVSFRGLSATHSANKVFMSTGVTIAEVQRTSWLLRELYQQGIESKREAGYVVLESKTGRTNTLYGNAADIVARDAEATLAGRQSPYKPVVVAEAERLMRVAEKQEEEQAKKTA